MLLLTVHKSAPSFVLIQQFNDVIQDVSRSDQSDPPDSIMRSDGFDQFALSAARTQPLFLRLVFFYRARQRRAW
jgi:hypothetical protein